MQIQTTTNRQNFTPNFKALHIADAGNLSLYKITDLSDKKYLKTLTDKIKLSELMPNLKKQEAERWNEMLEYAVDNAQYPENITYLETHNNRPCGIITFRTENKTTFLDCICTFPTFRGSSFTCYRIRMSSSLRYRSLPATVCAVDAVRTRCWRS